MMNRVHVTMAVVAAALAAGVSRAADPPTGEELLRAMDRNLTFTSRTSRMRMTVEGRRTRTYELVSFARGEEDAAIEYVHPPRDKGTRMLKLAGELWIYLPAVDRVQKISGHMLRQGMMGSDLSYEDLMTSRETEKR
ncbi:MAG: outer membrane lipoprotein-sorting protein, partial [bacterium]